MAYKALHAAGLPFELVRAKDVRNGCLGRFSAIFVPGGWASNKIKALGDEGAESIRQFVQNGGSYVGFCGGAGLATLDGIGLLNVRRRPTRDRVPSFSGRIRLKISDDAIWQGVSEPLFHAWWPSQFVADESVSILATYGEALPDAFSSDVNVGDTQSLGRWPELERTYGINLDPGRLLNEPAVLEGSCGAGRVLLSLVHFDTPDDANGAVVLKNLWSSLLPQEERASRIPWPDKKSSRQGESTKKVSDRVSSIGELESSVNGLIDLGMRNFLWFRRNPLLLQWRRGVRGLEYCTLQIMVQEIAMLLTQMNPGVGAELSGPIERASALVVPFTEKARQLLIKERFALQSGHITYERCDDPEIQLLRDELFSKSKSHGGRFKDAVDALDLLLYGLLIRD